MARPRGKYHDFTCEECGGWFEYNDSYVRKAKKEKFKIRFCSLKCRTEWYNKNKKTRKEIWNKYNKKRSTKINKNEWAEIRDFGRKLTKEKCEVCGSIKDLVGHHTDYNKNNNDPNNHQILCRSCHAKVHNFGQIRRSK